MVQEFKRYLEKQNLSENTAAAYLRAVKQYENLFGDAVGRKEVNEFKAYLIEHYKPRSVNLRIQGLNRFLKSIGREELKLSFVKVQQKPFLERVISEADYLYFKECLKKDKTMKWYFVVRFMASTGARVSELTQIKAEHIHIGYLDLYGKGGKLRRIYIPERLRREALSWLAKEGKKTGFVFVNRDGKRLSARGIAGQLKFYAVKYGIDPGLVYPHSFRHRFAKSFLQRSDDIAMLADLMGHESIETTRIYLRKTSSEQQELINRIVNW